MLGSGVQGLGDMVFIMVPACRFDFELLFSDEVLFGFGFRVRGLTKVPANLAKPG